MRTCSSWRRCKEEGEEEQVHGVKAVLPRISCAASRQTFCHSTQFFAALICNFAVCSLLRRATLVAD